MTTKFLVGSGLRREIAARLTELGARPRALVADERVLGLWPDVAEALVAAAGPLEIVRLPAGEAAKTREVLARTQDALIGLRRDEAIVALGGGAATDLAGFAAATLRRGLPWAAVPTTVVGMVDAAHGGKTGINHPRGKNLLGAFHAPLAVLADVDFLTTLDERERRAGAAEVFKAGRIGDPALCGCLEAGQPAPGDAAPWIGLVQAASAVKRALVERDFRDEGERRLLNYGHTVGHALETLLGNQALRHGEAVAIGMQVAIHLARARGLVAAEAPAEQERTLTALGLPTRLPPGVAPDAVLAGVALDKKRPAGARHTLVLPAGAEGCTLAGDVTDAELAAALAACA